MGLQVTSDFPSLRNNSGPFWGSLGKVSRGSSETQGSAKPDTWQARAAEWVLGRQQRCGRGREGELWPFCF